MNIKMLNRNNLPHDLLLIIRQKKTKKTKKNNTSTDIKLSGAQISKIIQSQGL